MACQLSRDYPTELLLSYEEELIGASFFTQLSTFHDGATKRVLLLLAQVEHIMANALRPFVRVWCSHLPWRTCDVLHLTGILEANELCGWSSVELASQLSATFALEVEDIVRLLSNGAFAPDSARAVMQQYLEHEQAIVDTLRSRNGPRGWDCSFVEVWLSRYAQRLK